MKYSLTKLKNGLQLIISPLNSTEAVTVLVLLPVGSRYESAEVNGVSHFIEHLLFKGTKKRPTALDISRELDAVGAEFNAFTAKDQTGYYVKVAADKIELAFDILSDMLFDATFASAEIERERGVIIEEINMYQDNPLMYVEDVFEQTAFASHQLGQLISGPRQVIRTISRNKIISYRRRFYNPKNMVLAVSGAASSATARRLAEKFFVSGRAATASAPTYKKFAVTQTKPRATLVYKKTEQVQVCVGFPAYRLSDPKMSALYLLAVILGGNMSSRLFTRVREQHGLAYFIRSSISAYQDTGLLFIQSGLDPRRIKKALGLISTELRAIKESGVTAQELAAAKEFLKGKLILDLEDSDRIADWLGKQQLLLRKIQTPQQRIAKLKAVTAAQVQRAANEVINKKRTNLAMIGPFTNKNEFLTLLDV